MPRCNLLTLITTLFTTAAALAGPVNNLTQVTTHNTIQDAINAAIAGDVIEADPGTYLESIDFLGKAITLRSASGDPADTIIDGTGAFHVVTCDTGETAGTVLEGFTVTGGNANGASPDNHGGGMYNSGASPTVTNCVFTANTSSSFAGGMLNISGSNPTVTNCVFTDNSAGTHGGGMMNFSSSSPTVTNCLFNANSAGNRGGGIMSASSSNPTVTNCAFYDNSAAAGGGLLSESGAATLTNCIMWANTPEQATSLFAGTITFAYSNIQGGVGAVVGVIDAGGNISADPLFADADGADNIAGTLDDNLRLTLASPSIDAGDSTAPDLSGVTLDLDAGDRFVDVSSVADTGVGPAPIVDMGPYEFCPIRNITQGADYGAIQAAINAAAAGDIIEVCPGTYFENIDFNGLAVTLRSASGDPTDTIIDGTGGLHVVLCNSGEPAATVLEGFTITGGNANGGPFPGTRGGGMFNGNGASPTVNNCIFTNNSATVGGGISCETGRPTVTNCVFTNNTATSGFGGGFFLINNGGTSATLINCSFSENSGYGLWNETNNTTATNCIFWANTPGQVNGGSPAVIAYCDIQGGLPAGMIDGGGNIDADPLFADANLRLGPGSPCIDAADTDAYAAAGGGFTDLGGALRYKDDSGTTDTGAGLYTFLDMGPHEFQGASVGSCTADLDGDDDVDVLDFGLFAAQFGCPN